MATSFVGNEPPASDRTRGLRQRASKPCAHKTERAALQQQHRDGLDLSSMSFINLPQTPHTTTTHDTKP